MIDHVAMGVSRLEASATFFLKALAPLGVRVVMTAPKAVGLGQNGAPCLWLDGKLTCPAAMHIAFSAESRAQVDEFYRRAIAAGGQDNGQPGIRAAYHPDYYAAFVIGPDGHNVEVVCRRREP
jgi:catechol 2,3-dioxygenase-like lactoylglutathione lyase family enzyme